MKNQLNINERVYSLFENIISEKENIIYFNQSNLARKNYPCKVEYISDYLNYLPEVNFNLIDFYEEETKNNLYLFSSHVSALGFLQSNPLLNLKTSVFVILTNAYTIEHLQFIKSKFPFISKINLVFPKTIYGLIDDIKCLFFWDNKKDVRFYLENDNKVLIINVQDSFYYINTNSISFTAFRLQYKSKLFNYKLHKTTIIDFKHVLNIIK